jgi:hypothetical protein
MIKRTILIGLISLTGYGQPSYTIDLHPGDVWNFGWTATNQVLEVRNGWVHYRDYNDTNYVSSMSLASWASMFPWREEELESKTAIIHPFYEYSPNNHWYTNSWVTNYMTPAKIYSTITTNWYVKTATDNILFFSTTVTNN